MILYKKCVAVFFVIITLISCNSDKEVTAEDVAVAFFDAIYNQKDIKKATALCSPKFSKELKKYRTANQAARQLFNMSFDTVEISAALGDLKVRKEFQTSGNLTILFTGFSHEKKYKDLKKIRLIKRNNIWLVDKLLADPIPT